MSTAGDKLKQAAAGVKPKPEPEKFDYIRRGYQGKCDFCSRPALGAVCFITAGTETTIEGDKPVAIVGGPAGRKYKKVTVREDGHWGACVECATLVLAKDAVGLAKRSAESLAAQLQGLPLDMIQLTQAMMFWSAFEGETHPSSEHPEFPKS